MKWVGKLSGREHKSVLARFVETSSRFVMGWECTDDPPLISNHRRRLYYADVQISRPGTKARKTIAMFDISDKHRRLPCKSSSKNRSIANFDGGETLGLPGVKSVRYKPEAITSVIPQLQACMVGAGGIHDIVEVKFTCSTKLVGNAKLGVRPSPHARQLVELAARFSQRDL